MTTKLLQRMPDDIHGRLKALALENNVSVNTLVNQICEYYLSQGAVSPVERRLADLESRIAQIESAGFSSTKAPAGAGGDLAVRSAEKSVKDFAW